MTIGAFTAHVPEEVLDDLRERLTRTRWPDELPDVGWALGTPLDEVRAACEHWRTSYDWRALEARLNGHEQGIASVAGERMHFLHARAADPGAVPIVLLHGWPGSVVEFLDCIEPLVARGFHVVVPSLLGYGFSGTTTGRGVHVGVQADAVAELMTLLGYDRFVAQGGDWGALVTRELGERHGARLFGVHLTMLFAGGGDMGAATPEEQQAMADAGRRITDGIGYLQIQSSKPQTLAYGQADSPAGLAAWILEKFEAWTDPRHPLGLDRQLDDITLYWVTNTANSAARLYYESAHAANGAMSAWEGRVDVPTGHAVFPYELLQTPRAWAEDRYRIVHWTRQPRGGHFAAFEQPELFVDDVAAFAGQVA